MSAYTWTVRVTSTDGRTARVSSRRQQFVVTRPLTFDIEEEGVTALEYTLGALGAELVTGLRELARRRRLHLEDLEAVVTGELNNPLTYLEVVGEEGDAALSRVQMKLYISSSEPAETIEALVRQAVDLLPQARTFRGLVSLELQIHRML
jgi:uncharacterized OsmC-like protein